MVVRFRKGAILSQLARMKSGTGRMRDVTGLALGDIQRALRLDEAPEDVAALIVSHVGKGVLADGSEKEILKEQEPEQIEEETTPEVEEEAPLADTAESEDVAEEEEPEPELEETEAVEIDITLSVPKLLAKIKAGDYPAEAVRELESKQAKPRATLLAGIEELED